MPEQIECKRVTTAGIHLLFGGSLIKFLRNTMGPVLRNPLLWALPLQTLLLLSNLDLLDPWNDEWFTLTHVTQPLSQVVFTDPMHPPLYNVVLHYWTRQPWSLSLLASMRAMSAVWTLVATVVIYVLW